MLSAYENKRVLVTGHTGFKGSWLSLFLEHLGAQVFGVGLQPDDTEESLFELLSTDHYTQSFVQDIRDPDAMTRIIEEIQPDCVFHLAAQSLVRPSYADPLDSFSTNVMGTANVLEAIRIAQKDIAVVCVTTDKVYDNVEWVYPYRESDRIMGSDPYSASKAGAETVAACYLRRLYPAQEGARARLGIARGGNVIGGGDWAQDRIVPDAVRSLINGVPLRIRNPNAVRPWQHVMELCHGYMQLGLRLMSNSFADFEGAWNFGPDTSDALTVSELIELLRQGLPDHPIQVEMDAREGPPEANYLTLDISKARNQLRWSPLLNAKEATKLTAQWYDSVLSDRKTAPEITRAQLESYLTSRTSS